MLWAFLLTVITVFSLSYYFLRPTQKEAKEAKEDKKPTKKRKIKAKKEENKKEQGSNIWTDQVLKTQNTMISGLEEKSKR